MDTKNIKSKIKANKKKIIVLSAMVALLVITGALNIFLGTKLPSDKDANNPAVQETFFSAYRSEREATRTQMFSYLDAIIANKASNEEAIASAQNKKLELCATMEKELVLEGLIKAKGYADSVVTMSTNKVNIIVKNAKVTADDGAIISNIIVRETGLTPNDIVIIPYTA